MVNFIRKWIFNLVKPRYKDEYENAKISSNTNIGIAKSVADGIQTRDNSIRFTIHQATGGKIVETSRYMSDRDRDIRGLYIIEKSEDLGKKLEHIITMELLK